MRALVLSCRATGVGMRLWAAQFAPISIQRQFPRLSDLQLARHCRFRKA